MTKPIDRIRAKVTRAKQHIEDLNLALRAFHDTAPYAVSTKEDPAAGNRIYYISKADCIPTTLETIAADIIQNLRSPLDHIAYQLVLAGNPQFDGKVYYPIRDLAAHYPSARGAIAKHVRQEVIDAIDATEPYQGGKGHKLWQLNALNNPDKHQLLIGAVAHGGVDLTPMLASAFPGLDKAFSLTIGSSSPAKVGDVLLIESLDSKVAEYQRFRFDVSLYKPGVIESEPALKTLQDLANFVDDIVTQLGRFLP